MFVPVRKLAAISFLLASSVAFGADTSWKDPSPHTVRHITVDQNVQLEVLDWGGTGRPIVLLAGLGHSAHLFDDFALKLKPRYRVVGITRRGYGGSSVPEGGYSSTRLAEDTFEVIRALKLKKPLIAGHSIAGLELTALAEKHPEDIAGLVYLDAAPEFDAAAEALKLYQSENFKKRLQDMKSRLSSLEGEPRDPTPDAKALIEQLPQFESDLQTLIAIERARPPRPDATPADLQSFATVREWYARGSKIWLPEAEFRQMLTIDAAGHPTMTRRFPPRVGEAIREGREKHVNKSVPVLALIAAMNEPDPAAAADPATREQAATYASEQTHRAERRAADFVALMPDAEVTVFHHADDYVFLSNEAQVLRKIDAFSARLN